MILQHTKNLDELDANALRALLIRREQELAESYKKNSLYKAQAHDLALAKEQLKAQQTVLQNKSADILYKDAVIAKLTHEIAVLRRFRFGKKSEQLQGVQGSLLEETVASDIAAIEQELQDLSAGITQAPEVKQKPKRSPLPANLPRIEIRHEPKSTTCNCGCQLNRIGEDISEKLDYIPGVAQVERHIRGKWVCRKCETLVQEPVPAHVIDKGIATTGLLAHVLVAKYADHLPLYRQEKIFERSGIKLPRSTMAQWVGVCGVRLQPLVDELREYILSHGVLHADETPVTMLRPDTGKTTHKAYLWAYAPTSYEDKKAVVYEFKPSRAGEHARSFLKGWSGKLVVDDFSGYKKGFLDPTVLEISCWAHARRKFFDLYEANQSPIAKQALDYIGKLYELERQARELDKHERWQLRQSVSKPIIEKYHDWLQAQMTIATGPGIKKAINYSLKNWDTLVRYLDDGAVPMDNNHIEQQIRPIAVGKKNWLFAGSLRGGERSAAVMSLIQSAKLNGIDPYAYLKDVLTRLPTHPNSRIQELLPHNWQPEDIQ